MVIVPTISLTHKLLVSLFFNPYLFCRILLQLLKKRIKACIPGFHEKPLTTRMIRTDCLASQYKIWMEEVGGQARCIAYNPYHPVYKNARLEGNILVPIYRNYYKLKRMFKPQPPFLETSSGIEICYLLLCKKNESADEQSQ